MCGVLLDLETRFLCGPGLWCTMVVKDPSHFTFILKRCVVSVSVSVSCVSVCVCSAENIGAAICRAR